MKEKLPSAALACMNITTLKSSLLLKGSHERDKVTPVTMEMSAIYEKLSILQCIQVSIAVAPNCAILSGHHL